MKIKLWAQILACASVAFLSGLLSQAAAQTSRPAASSRPSPQPVAQGNKKVVYAWFPAHPGAAWDAKTIDWTALTHICYRSIMLNADGTVQEGANRNWVAKLVDEAHKHGVKVTVLVWGKRGAADEYLAKAPAKAAQSLLEYVKANNLDGICIDDETWRQDNSVTKGSNRELVTGFFRGLRAAFKKARPDYHIAWASPPLPNLSYYLWIDFPAITDEIDAFAIMSYCMTPATAGWAGSSQPIQGGPAVRGIVYDYASCLKYYLEASGKKPGKLLLGIDILRGGCEWTCATDKPLSRTLDPGRKLTEQEAQANARKYGRRWDPAQKSPWYCYQQGKNWVQGWYDDDESLAMKFALAREANIAGVCLWVLSEDERAETFAMIHKELLKTPSAASKPSPAKPTPARAAP